MRGQAGRVGLPVEDAGIISGDHLLVVLGGGGDLVRHGLRRHTVFQLGGVESEALGIGRTIHRHLVEVGHLIEDGDVGRIEA